MRSLLFFLCCFFIFISARAAEPFFKKDDVIALVGGEDMVVASEYGYLELLLTRALPDYHLRFRNLAWEGDTVFEQRRDLNFPTWEEQLDKIGATVVIVQFGQMESLAGRAKIPEFVAAYQALLTRLSGDGKRRVVIVQPTPYWRIPPIADAAQQGRSDDLNLYGQAAEKFAEKSKFRFAEIFVQEQEAMRLDGIHFSALGHLEVAVEIAESVAPAEAVDNAAADQPKNSHSVVLPKVNEAGGLNSSGRESLRQLIIAKNRLWFDYWRPQNWAFLAGDRVNQPSSRDWRDPSIRWFPPEREQFLPLIEAKEKEIDALAQKLAQP
jgi:hypothetical protein